MKMSVANSHERGKLGTVNCAGKSKSVELIKRKLGDIKDKEG